jgi:hypothetical protein
MTLVAISQKPVMQWVFEDIKNNTVVLKNEGKKIVTNYNGDVGLYVITFNSPKQFETFRCLIEMLLKIRLYFVDGTCP